MIARIQISLLLAVGVLFAPNAFATPEVDLHELTFYVHVDLIDAGAGQDLPFWQALVDDMVTRGSDLLEGRNGPADQVCCTRITQSAPLVTFGTTGDGLDIIDSAADQTALDGIGTGSRAFLVDMIDYCSGPGGAIGCAEVGSCGNPNDDPDLWLYLSVFDDVTGEILEVLPSVLAHERGHNSCLNHVAGDDCQIMQAAVIRPGMGGCVVASECTSFRNGRTELSSDIDCDCQDDLSLPLADGNVCGESGGVCSGGLCGSITGDAGVTLIAAADSGEGGLGPEDAEDALRLSGLTGDWENLGPIGAGAENIRAMAYAHDSATLYGVVPTVSNDELWTIDPDTGAMISSVGTIVNGTDEIVAMAYDPGATSGTGDDRLIVLEVTGGGPSATGEFRAIDPATPSSTTLLGGLPFTNASAFSGMAYDSVNGRLFLSTPFGPHGIYETDLSTCPPSSCTTTQLPGSGGLFRANGSLSYSKDSGMLYLVGTSLNASPANIRTFYDVIDPATGFSIQTLSVDRFTPAAMAAVPESNFVMVITAGAVALALTERRRNHLSA